MAKSKLTLLKETRAYADVQQLLYNLQRRMEELEKAEDALSFLREEAAIAEQRWQLHNAVRELVWEIEKD